MLVFIGVSDIEVLFVCYIVELGFGEFGLGVGLLGFFVFWLLGFRFVL